MVRRRPHRRADHRPALQRASENARSEVSFQIGALAHKVYPVAGTLTILLGVVLAVLGGRVTSLDGLLSPYGITVIVALALALGVWTWGEFVIGPAMRCMQTAPPADRPPLLGRALKFVALEQCGFLAVFGCMVLMRFGV